MAFQKVVYPLTAFLVSAVIFTAAKPKMFENSPIIIEIVIVSLFIVGVIHVIGRLRDGFLRFTSYDDNIHDSILDDADRKLPTRSRYAVAGVLLVSTLAAFGVGYVIGLFINFPAELLPDAFSSTLRPEFIFYPPIVTFFVDIMHTIASRLER